MTTKMIIFVEKFFKGKKVKKLTPFEGNREKRRVKNSMAKAVGYFETCN